jgi:hypothetical protein
MARPSRHGTVRHTINGAGGNGAGGDDRQARKIYPQMSQMYADKKDIQNLMAI